LTTSSGYDLIFLVVVGMSLLICIKEKKWCMAFFSLRTLYIHYGRCLFSAAETCPWDICQDNVQSRDDAGY
jgi:hypothetical protein